MPRECKISHDDNLHYNQVVVCSAEIYLLTSELVRQDCGSSRFRRLLRGDGADVGDGGGMSACVFSNCCADCCNKCVKFLIPSPSSTGDCFSSDETDVGRGK